MYLHIVVVGVSCFKYYLFICCLFVILCMCMCVCVHVFVIYIYIISGVGRCQNVGGHTDT